MDWLKEILKEQGMSEEQIVAAMANINVKLPLHFVPKDKYNSKAEEVKTLSAQIVERDTQLTDIKKASGDGEEKLKAKLEELEASNKTAKEEADKAVKEAEAQFNQKTLDLMLSNEITKAKGRNEKAIKALLDLENVKIVDGKLFGFDEQIESIKTKETYLFDDGEENVTTPTGSNPANTYVGKAFADLTSGERMAFKQKDPAKYELQRQAWLLNKS